MNTQNLTQISKKAAYHVVQKKWLSWCYLLLLAIAFEAPSIEANPSQAPLPYALSLSAAFEKALANHGDIQLARNRLDQSKAQTATKFGALMPKVRVEGSVIRNIPEVLDRLPVHDPVESTLYRDVANLVRKGGDAAEADILEQHADAMLRRDANPRFVFNPKYETRGGLTLEIPLFSGPDLAFLISSSDSDALAYSRVKEVTAKTLKKTALAYFSAVHHKDLLEYQRVQESNAQEHYLLGKRSKHATAAARLHAQSLVIERQAETERAFMEYQRKIAELGLLVGLDTNLVLDESPSLNFDVLGEDAEHLLERALQNRWDLKSEQRAIDVAQGGRLSNFLSFLPTFTLQGDAFYTSNDKSLIGENFLYAISLNARFYLFEGGIGFSRLREADLRRQEHEIKYRELTKEIGLNVRAQKAAIGHLHTLIKAYEAKAVAASESEKNAEQQYKNQKILFEDYIEIVDRRITADINLKKARADLINERISLLYEAGMFTPQ